jgi:transcription elongation GreA/GreB family factor
MSVAFRRESDEEHLEPKFELPIPPGPNLVTPRGLRLIGERVAELEAALATASATDAEPIKRDLRYWNTRLATAELAPPPEPGEVGIGSRIDFQLNCKARRIDIVGADEADPANDRIGYAAPLARAMIGGVVGERLDFNGATGAIEIVAIGEQQP